MHCVQWIVNCNNNCISSSTFSPSIEKITLWALKNLKGWCACSEEAVAQGCHSVKLDSLYIRSCPKLISFPQQSKVRKLELNDVGLKLLEEVSNHIEVEILVMRYIEGLKSLSGILPNLTALSEFHLLNCEDLDPCNDEYGCYSMKWKQLKNLKVLKFHNIPNMEYLPDGLQYVTTLQTLSIESCTKFKYLPEWAKPLQELIFQDCQARGLDP